VKAARYARLSVTEGLIKDCAGSIDVVSSILDVIHEGVHSALSTRDGRTIVSHGSTGSGRAAV
jgi:hypothetical protein